MLEILWDSNWPMTQFNRVPNIQKVLTTPAKPRNHNRIVQNALKALRRNIAPEEFADNIRGMEKEEFDTLLESLPEEMKTNPK